MTFKKGYKPWNKGLTKETDKRIEKISIKGRTPWNKNMNINDMIKVNPNCVKAGFQKGHKFHKGSEKGWFTTEKMRGNTHGFKKGEWSINKLNPEKYNNWKEKNNKILDKNHLRNTGKTYEELYGNEKAKQLKEKRRLLYLQHSEKHPNYVMAHTRKGKGYISKPQKELYSMLKLLYGNNIKMEYPECHGQKLKFLDIAIPELKLDFEYDGEHWHKDKEKDNIRDNELKKLGWIIIRIKKDDLKELKRVLNIPSFIINQFKFEQEVGQ